MWRRTITIGSAGKTFSVTGWKTGWAMAPDHLLEPLRLVHQNCTFTCPTVIQVVVVCYFLVNCVFIHFEGGAGTFICTRIVGGIEKRQMLFSIDQQWIDYKTWHDGWKYKTRWINTDYTAVRIFHVGRLHGGEEMFVYGFLLKLLVFSDSTKCAQQRYGLQRRRCWFPFRKMVMQRKSSLLFCAFSSFIHCFVRN
jgi:hypothetical protein